MAQQMTAFSMQVNGAVDSVCQGVGGEVAEGLDFWAKGGGVEGLF